MYLADLHYISEKSNAKTTVPVPLNIAYIAAYLEKYYPETFEIKLFKVPDDLWEQLNVRMPDIAAFSSYVWNHNLTHQFIREVKKKNPQTLTLMGGPNFHSDDEEWTRSYMPTYPDLDFYLVGEGELNMREFARVYLEHGGSVDKLKRTYIEGSVSVHPDTGQVSICNHRSSKTQMKELDDIPSPYLTGWLDEYLDNPNFSPILETNRGCPFACAFCNWGNATKSSVRQFSEDRLIEELNYIAKRNKSHSPYLYLADANFGILKRDIRLSRELRRIADETGFPGKIYMYYTKNSSKKIIEMGEILRDVFDEMTLSLQSMTDHALDLIKRKNIKLQTFFELYEYCKQKGLKPSTELIYGLPGEGLEDFYDGIKALLDHGMNRIHMIALRLEAGTELGRTDSRKKYGFKTKFRAISQCMGIFANGNISTSEYEEIVCANNWMPQEDYFKIRLLHFFFAIFGKQFDVYNDLVHYINQESLSLSHFILGMARDVDRTDPVCREVFDAFLKDASDELLDDMPTSWTPEMIENLSKRKISLNVYYLLQLLYKEGALESFNAFILKKLCEQKAVTPEREKEIASLLSNVLDRRYHYDQPLVKKTVTVPFNYPAWKNDPEGKPLRAFKSSNGELKVAYEKNELLIKLYERYRTMDCDYIEKMYLFQRANMEFPQSMFFYENASILS